MATAYGRAVIAGIGSALFPGVGAWIVTQMDKLSLSHSLLVWCGVFCLTSIGFYAMMAALDLYFVGSERRRIDAELRDLDGADPYIGIQTAGDVWANYDVGRSLRCFRALRTAVTRGDIPGCIALVPVMEIKNNILTHVKDVAGPDTKIPFNALRNYWASVGVL